MKREDYKILVIFKKSPPNKKAYCKILAINCVVTVFLFKQVLCPMFMKQALKTILESGYNLQRPQNLESVVPFQGYVNSKTEAERELLSYGSNENGRGLEVVSLACGLVGGDTLLSYTPSSVSLLLSPLQDNEATYQSLKFLEDLIGKIPVVHIHDVCEAHIFCAETPSINGRFLVASSFSSTADLANYYLQTHPQFHLKK